jgi:hypothetical protein
MALRGRLARVAVPCLQRTQKHQDRGDIMGMTANSRQRDGIMRRIVIGSGSAIGKRLL